MTDFHRSLDHALSGEPRWPAPEPEVDPHNDWMLFGSPEWQEFRTALAHQEIPAEGTE